MVCITFWVFSKTTEDVLQTSGKGRNEMMQVRESHLETSGPLPCAQCASPLDHPTWSEPVNARQVRHLWNCQDCGYVFETMVYFCDDAGQQPTSQSLAA